ncbi:MAG: HAD-IA family hydrolase [Ignavibacteria bacterium]|nr:HAD-IA family hydrolase [Ignavibacteria bacterium]
MIYTEEIRVLTLDCYGTLIDWETGITSSLQTLLSNFGIFCDNEIILELYAGFESEIERNNFISYKKVLEEVGRKFCEYFSIPTNGVNELCILNSFQNWEPFPDTIETLTLLKSKYKIVVISNVDDDLFKITSKKLKVEFDDVITSQQAKSYKPSLSIFKFALEKLGVEPKDILHIAQSLYHDVKPAKELGIKAIWVNRRKDKKGTGATPFVEIHPDFEVPDLKSLVNLLIY